MTIKKFKFTLPATLADAITKKDQEQLDSHSNLMRSAGLKYHGDEKKFEDLMGYGKSIGKDIGILSEEEVAEVIREKRRQTRA